MPQVPLEHVAVPLVLSQVLLQAPQLAGLVFRLVSQPLATLPSQLP